MTSLRRMIKHGLQWFSRNGWLSVGTTSIMALTLLVVGGIVLAGSLGELVLTNLEEKVDVTVYFTFDAENEEIVALQHELERLPEVRSVEYISREKALETFRNRHSDDAVITQSLDELDDNPLQASLNVTAQETQQLEEVSNFLASPTFASFVDSVNYQRNRDVIERLDSIIGAVRRGGLGLSIALAVIVVVVTFNAIRITMYHAREEIGVMRLVGAKNWYIRGPFVVVGVLYGAIAATAAFGVLAGVAWALAPRASSFLPVSNLFAFFQANAWELFGILVVVGVVLGVVSSMIAMRRYLKV